MINYPIKTPKIPNILIYTCKKKSQNGSIRLYSKMFELKSGKVVAIMNSEKEMIERDNEIIPSLYIDVIKSYKKRNGYGTKMLDFAKILSKKYGCNGYFHLIASGEFSPDAVPHLFYRKYGMNTGNYELDKKIDKYIKWHKSAKRKIFPNVDMYYPPREYQKINKKTGYTIFSMLKSIFKIFPNNNKT